MDLSSTEALALLRLQIEWGADEALDEPPHSRLAAPAQGLPSRLPQPAPAATGAGIPVLQPAFAGPQAFRAAEPPPIPPLPAPPLPRPPLPAPAPIRGQIQQAEDLAASADSIEALQIAVAGFTGCTLRDTASHTLFAQGDAGTGLMLIGEVPDADEDRAGHAFAGASGALLDRMLGSIGLSRSGILVAPLIPWRPPGDRRASPVEMATCLPFLHRLVVLARPTHLLLMGVRPARALLATEASLARLRGRWMPAPVPGLPAPVPALPMRHPNHLLANPLSRRDAWHDLLQLRAALDAKPSQGRDGLGEQPP